MSESKRTAKVTVTMAPEMHEYYRTQAFNEHVTISTYLYNLLLDDYLKKQK